MIRDVVEQEVVVHAKTGLHARPASQFVQKAARFLSNVYIEYDGRKVNAKSIMGVLGAGISQGAKITIIADGLDAEEAVKTLTDLVESNFGEDEE